MRWANVECSIVPRMSSLAQPSTRYYAYVPRRSLARVMLIMVGKLDAVPGIRLLEL